MGSRKYKEGDMVPVDQDGNLVDLSAMEESGIAYDPSTQHLDLGKEEKRRCTALLMAIQANRDLIIKDAAYLEAVADLAERGKGPKIRPATMDSIVEAALNFDAFISGDLQRRLKQSAPEEEAAS